MNLRSGGGAPFPYCTLGQEFGWKLEKAKSVSLKRMQRHRHRRGRQKALVSYPSKNISFGGQLGAQRMLDCAYIGWHFRFLSSDLGLQRKRDGAQRRPRSEEWGRGGRGPYLADHVLDETGSDAVVPRVAIAI